jgi:hypothetical protein
VSDLKVPRDLQSRVRKYLERNPAKRWDAAVGAIGRECRMRRK